jgi:hypothetical protein
MAEGDRELTVGYCSRVKARNKVEQLLYCRCGREILMGSRIHVHQNDGGWKPLRLCHSECWEELFLDC